MRRLGSDRVAVRRGTRTRERATPRANGANRRPPGARVRVAVVPVGTHGTRGALGRGRKDGRGSRASVGPVRDARASVFGTSDAGYRRRAPRSAQEARRRAGSRALPPRPRSRRHQVLPAAVLGTDSAAAGNPRVGHDRRGERAGRRLADRKPELPARRCRAPARDGQPRRDAARAVSLGPLRVGDRAAPAVGAAERGAAPWRAPARKRRARLHRGLGQRTAWPAPARTQSAARTRAPRGACRAAPPPALARRRVLEATPSAKRPRPPPARKSAPAPHAPPGPREFAREPWRARLLGRLPGYPGPKCLVRHGL